MTGLLWAVLGTFGGLGMTVIGDMVSEEIRDRLDHVPHAILRLAARRLDPALRASLYEEVWLPDLAYHLKGDEARPVTRLYHGICFAVGMLASAHRSSRNLNGARPQDNNDAVAAVIDAAKAVVAPFRLGEPQGLDASISGNRLVVTGEIDIANEKSLRAALLALDKVPAATLILDFTGVSFMGIRGVHAVADYVEKLTPPRQLVLACQRKTARIFILATSKHERATWPLRIDIQEGAVSGDSPACPGPDCVQALLMRGVGRRRAQRVVAVRRQKVSPVSPVSCFRHPGQVSQDIQDTRAAWLP
jgi:anti-anti-sigma regulatory factor